MPHLFFFFLWFFSFPFLHLVYSCCLGLHFSISITESCNLMSNLLIPLQRWKTKSYLANLWKTITWCYNSIWMEKTGQSNNTYKLPLLYRGAAANDGLAAPVQFSKLGCEPTFKPKLAQLSKWTSTALWTSFCTQQPPTCCTARQGSSLAMLIGLKPVTRCPQNSLLMVQKAPAKQYLSCTLFPWSARCGMKTGLQANQDNQDDSLKSKTPQ